MDPSPDELLRAIGLLGMLLAAAALIGLSPNPCGHDECAKTCERVTRIEKVRHHTKLHAHHSLPNAYCEHCARVEPK